MDFYKLGYTKKFGVSCWLRIIEKSTRVGLQIKKNKHGGSNESVQCVNLHKKKLKNSHPGKISERER